MAAPNLILSRPVQTPDFRPIPRALCDRIRAHVGSLAKAETTDAQIAAMFLAHCELKHAESLIARPANPAQQARQRIKESFTS